MTKLNFAYYKELGFDVLVYFIETPLKKCDKMCKSGLKKCVVVLAYPLEKCIFKACSNGKF